MSLNDESENEFPLIPGLESRIVFGERGWYASRSLNIHNILTLLLLLLQEQSKHLLYTVSPHRNNRPFQFICGTLLLRVDKKILAHLLNRSLIFTAESSVLLWWLFIKSFLYLVFIAVQ
jgi:hypothetical protein